MSYDLYFTNRSVNLAEFAKYFGSRNHYKSEGNQAFYQNEETGVYFSFEFADGDESDPEFPPSNILFNLNFYRPHIFALEAEPEVHLLVKEFGFGVFDSQTNGMSEGVYSTEGFLRGWNHGNEFGYQAVLGSQNTPQLIHCQPNKTIENAWRWNYVRNSVQEKFGEQIFVPKIFFISLNNNVATAVIWGDAIPTLIPEVDYLIIPRKSFAPSTIFSKAKKEDRCLVSFSEAKMLFAQYVVDGFSVPAYKLDYPFPPVSIEKFVKRLRPSGEKIQILSSDSVLNEELVQKYKKTH